MIQTRQLRDFPSPALERVYHVLSPEQIVERIDSRYAARYEAFSRMLEGEKLTERDEDALARFEDLQLGSTRVAAEEGRKRMREWFAISK